MAIKLPKAFTELLQKPMDRKEFLKNAGTAGLFVVGAGMIVKSTGGLSEWSDSRGSNASRAKRVASASAYGTRIYGQQAIAR